MYKYTFLLPAYKAIYFVEALRSIKNQSYNDFYCIVSDDCSPDNLEAIFQQEVGSDKRFVYRRNNTNIGATNLVQHWNLLLKECKTEYVVLASDDDIYDLKFLEELDRYTDRYNNVNLFRARVRFVDETGEPIEVDPLFEEKEAHLPFLFKMYNTNFIHCIANYIFKTEYLKNINGFADFPLAWFSDDATVIKASGNGVACSSNVLFSFRVSGYNISNANKDKYTKKLKVEATQAFYYWFRCYLDGLVFPHTKLNECLINKIKKGCINRVNSMITFYSSGLGYIHLFDIFMWRRNNGLFEGVREKVTYWWCLFTELKSLFR